MLNKRFLRMIGEELSKWYDVDDGAKYLACKYHVKKDVIISAFKNYKQRAYRNAKKNGDPTPFQQEMQKRKDLMIEIKKIEGTRGP